MSRRDAVARISDLSAEAPAKGQATCGAGLGPLCALAAVFVEPGAAVATRPAAPQHLVLRGGHADHRRRRPAARTGLARQVDAPAPLRLRLPPAEHRPRP